MPVTHIVGMLCPGPACRLPPASCLLPHRPRTTHASLQSTVRYLSPAPAATSDTSPPGTDTLTLRHSVGLHARSLDVHAARSAPVSAEGGPVRQRGRRRHRNALPHPAVRVARLAQLARRQLGPAADRARRQQRQHERQLSAHVTVHKGYR